jgi:hypothetical protein
LALGDVMLLCLAVLREVALEAYVEQDVLVAGTV